MKRLSLLTQSRIWRQTFESLRHDQLPLRAAALSFQTLASLVPTLAIVLAVLATPAFKDYRDEVVAQGVKFLVPSGSYTDNEAVEYTKLQTKSRERFSRFVERVSTNVGTISVFAFVALQVLAMFLFQTVEAALNTIWKVKSGRTMLHRALLTTALIFWAPVMMSISVALGKMASDYQAAAGALLLPFFLTGLGFAAFYMIMPNARVRFVPAFAAGLVAALLWELSKVGFMLYVRYVVSESRVYGSLGLLPMIFGWVYVSWLVLLTGAELGYILQTVGGLGERWLRVGKAAPARGAPQGAAALPPLALAAAIEIGRHFRSGTDSPGARHSDLAHTLGVDPPALDEALGRLLAAGLVVRVAEEGIGAASLDPRYLPARDPTLCPLPELARACRGGATALGRGPAWESAGVALARLEQDGERATAGVTLADLCQTQAQRAET